MSTQFSAAFAARRLAAPGAAGSDLSRPTARPFSEMEAGEPPAEPRHYFFVKKCPATPPCSNASWKKGALLVV